MPVSMKRSNSIWSFQTLARGDDGNTQYTPPTRRNCRVESRRRRAVWTQFATSSRRLLTDSVDNLETEDSGLTTWILIDIDNFFNNDVIMSVTNLKSSTAQEIVNWVTTADWCVHTADTTQLDFAVGKFVQTRRDCRQLVANCVHTADAADLFVGPTSCTILY